MLMNYLYDAEYYQKDLIFILADMFMNYYCGILSKQFDINFSEKVREFILSCGILSKEFII